MTRIKFKLLKKHVDHLTNVTRVVEKYINARENKTEAQKELMAAVIEEATIDVVREFALDATTMTKRVKKVSNVHSGERVAVVICAYRSFGHISKIRLDSVTRRSHGPFSGRIRSKCSLPETILTTSGASR